MVATPEKSLAEILAHHMHTGEPIPVRLTLSILRQICDALDWAHNLCDPAGRPLGIVHRDVSPAYIFISDAGAVRLVGSTSPRANAAYMAPEYITAGTLDSRADLFAIGVVAHEMLANRPLFATPDEQETLARVCTLAIPSPSSLNVNVAPDIDSIVLMALARDPTYRWQHAAMMRDGFQSVAQRLGFELGPGHADAWANLLAGRPDPKPIPTLPSVSFAVPTVPQPPKPHPAPAASDRWTDDTNQETQMRPGDPSLLDDDVDAFIAAVEKPAPAFTPVTAPAKHPRASTADVDAFVGGLDDAEPDPEPEPAPAAFAPSPASGRTPAPAFELEIPEATQIGAVPLISFGDTSIAVIGQPAPKIPRASAPTLPPPKATFLPSATVDDEPPPTSSKRLVIIIISAIAFVVIAALLVILFATDITD